MKGNTKKLAVMLIIVAMGMFVTAAMAVAADRRHDQTIEGDYAFTGESFCLSSVSGFNANLTTKPGIVYVGSHNMQGVMAFDRDGTAMLRGRAVGFSYYPPGTSGAGSWDFEASFTYSVEPDGTVTTTLNLPLIGTLLTGARAGQTFTEDLIRLSGVLTEDRKSLTLATDEPVISTLTYSNGDVIKQICHRSRIHFRLEENNGHGGPDRDHQ